jgi:hypothetical protein
MDSLREQLELLGLDEEDDWEEQEVGWRGARRVRAAGQRRGAAGRGGATRRGAPQQAARPAPTPRQACAVRRRPPTPLPHLRSPRRAPPRPLARGQEEEEDECGASPEHAAHPAASDGAPSPLDDGAPDDLTCAICLGQIPPLDLALVKGCEHQYCGARGTGARPGRWRSGGLGGGGG